MASAPHENARAAIRLHRWTAQFSIRDAVCSVAKLTLRETDDRAFKF